MRTEPTRRDFMRAAAGASLAAALPVSGCAQPQGGMAATPATGGAAAPFRFVHLTDIHVQPELNADQGLAQALQAVERLRPKPDFILTGGDNVFDVMESDAVRAQTLFDLYRRVLADHTSLPVYHAIGNHDVFGWRTKAGVTPQTPGYGKALAKDELGLKETYYTFDHKGWRFFVLDNILPGYGRRAYAGGLDPTQRDWLAERLQRTDARMPIALCEHIPMLSVTPFWYERNFKNGDWTLGDGLICGDAAARLALYRTRNVRLSLSGHIHQLDRVEYRGASYICDGAVSGAWWNGPRDFVEEGFGVIDVWPDGRVVHTYHDYGWAAKPAEKPA